MEDDARRRLDATKRQLIERAARLLGREQLARRLKVEASVVEAWVSGDATFPNRKLDELARILSEVQDAI